MIAARDLAFSYRRGGDELFDGMSFRFAPGRVTAVTGPSGRGKSTLLYVLGLMLRPTRGTIELAGRDVSAAPDHARARLRAEHIGFVFQDAVLDPNRVVLDSVIEPALYAGTPRRQAREQARSLLDALGLADRADHRPGEISGGQAQRAAVCRALVNNPAVVLADEPTGNLDRHNSLAVLDALEAASGNDRTVIIATHDEFVVSRAHEVLRL